MARGGGVADPSLFSLTPSAPALSSLNAGIFIVSVLGSSILHWRRTANGRKTARGQWFTDGLGIGTLIVLTLMVVAALLGRSDLTTEMVKENGLLITTSLIYCAVMIGTNLLDSIKNDA